MDIVVFGAGKIAEVVVSLLDDSPELSVRALTCDRDYVDAPERFGLPLVPFDEVETAFPPADHGMLVVIGYHQMNRLRQQRCQQARAMGYDLVSWVSPQAHVPASCALGANCVVMPGAALQPFARLGEGVFVWHNAVVGHHAGIGAHCWLASNCTVSSTAIVGERCFIGVNAAIGHDLTIGADSLIGAGTILTRSTKPEGVYIAGDTPRYRLDSRRFEMLAGLS